MAGEVETVEGEQQLCGDFSNHCGLIYYKDAAAASALVLPFRARLMTIYQGDVIVTDGW